MYFMRQARGLGYGRLLLEDPRPRPPSKKPPKCEHCRAAFNKLGPLDLKQRPPGSRRTPALLLVEHVGWNTIP